MTKKLTFLKKSKIQLKNSFPYTSRTLPKIQVGKKVTPTLSWRKKGYRIFSNTDNPSKE